jgi:hypothetical protein
LRQTPADAVGGWFFADTTSVSNTHPDELGGNSLGMRVAESTIGTYGTFATANGTGSGQDQITGLSSLTSSSGNTTYSEWVVNMTARKVWVRNFGDSTWLRGGDPSNTSSTPTFSLPSGTIYFGYVGYDGSNIISLDTSVPSVVTGNDSLVDSPTNYGAGGSVRGNYATFNGLITSTSVVHARQVFSNGNLDLTSGASGNYGTGASTISLVSGKWYCEMLITVPSGADSYSRYGITAITRDFFSAGNNHIGGQAEDHALAWSGGTTLQYASNDAVQYTYSGASASSGSIFMLAYDADAGELWFGIDGTWLTNASGTGNPATGSNPDVSGLSGPKYFVGSVYNGGTSNQISANFGQRPFAYTAPSGFKALCTTNLAEPTIADGSTAMDVALYTGNGSTQTISGLNFSPDFVWIKPRSIAEQHELYNIISGPNQALFTDFTDAETTVLDGLNTFNSDGFSLGNRSYVNGSGKSYVAWTWDAGSSTVTNNDGSISSQVRANASAGFSVVTYTGTGANATVGHGLGISPRLIIVKCRSTGSSGWPVYHASLNNNVIELQSTAAASSEPAAFQATAPTSTVFYVGTKFGTNGSSETFVAYCFAPVDGYSSAFSYTGNGSSDGPYTYLGFRSRFIIIKRTDTTGDWLIYDTARDSYNTMTKRLYPNLSNAEADASDQALDVTANGFKVRANNGNFNASGGTYIGFAFAESPFATSRAR